jgi:deazaflavin-dependent oxidoreductase (nitroreductase family)
MMRWGEGPVSEQSSAPRRVTRAWFFEALVEMRATGAATGQIQDLNDALIAEYRATDGESMGDFPLDIVGLITMRGARSGIERTVPLGIFPIEGRIFLVATQGGLPTHPQWYYNLLANPDITTEWRGETFAARAVLLDGEDREHIVRLLPEQPFDEYVQHTGSRVVPIFEIQRISRQPAW